MNLQELFGKSWTLSNLKGKKTFVSVWAPYCAPCMEELPYVQKLYELSLKRDGIQVITVITDARKYVEGVAGRFMIPMNWMVEKLSSSK